MVDILISTEAEQGPRYITLGNYANPGHNDKIKLTTDNKIEIFSQCPCFNSTD